MTQSYKLSDLILYSCCPLKYLLNKEYESLISYNADFRNVIGSALKDTFIKHYQMVGMRRPWNSSKATKFFSKQWHFYKSQFKDLELQLSRTTNLLMKAQDSVLNLDKVLPPTAEIAAVNFPTEIKVRDKIVTDSLDLVTVNQRSKKEKIVELYFFDESLHVESGNDFGMLMKATTGVSSAKKDLLGYSTKVKCYLLNVFSLEKREILLTKEHKTHYPRLLSNIVGGIEANAIYPRSSYESCKQCLYRNICTWKLK